MFSTVVETNRYNLDERTIKGRRHYSRAHLKTSLFGSENEEQDMHVTSDSIKNGYSTPYAKISDTNELTRHKMYQKQRYAETSSNQQEGNKDSARCSAFVGLDSHFGDAGYSRKQTEEALMESATSNPRSTLNFSTPLCSPEPSRADRSCHCFPCYQNQETNTSELCNPSCELNGKAHLDKPEAKSTNTNELVEAAALRAQRREWERKTVKATDEGITRDTEPKKILYTPLQAPWYTDPAEAVGNPIVERTSPTRCLNTSARTSNGNDSYQLDSPNRLKKRKELYEWTVAASSLPSIPYAQHH